MTKQLHRLGLVVGITLYILAFNTAYVELVAPIYHYFGLDYSPMSRAYAVAVWALCIVPALWLPEDIKRPSMILFLTQYLLIYIPAAFILHYSTKPRIDDAKALELQVAMLIGLSIMQATYYLPLASLKGSPLAPKQFAVLLAILVSVPLLYLAMTLGGTLQFSGLGSSNGTFRTEQSVAIKGASLGLIGIYGEFWMANVIFPWVAAVGLFCKRRGLVVIVIGGYVLLFGLSAFRAHLLGPLFILTVYAWTQVRRKYLMLFAALCFGLLAPLMLTGYLFEGARSQWIALWHMRTICIQGLTFGQYYGFFQDHNITYFTHLNIFNLLHLSDHPDLPYEIAEYYYHTSFGANANFWAADGLSSLGILGVPVMSAFCGALFWFLDSLAARYRLNFVLVCLAFMTVTFGNISLFTNLLSGGLGLFVLLLYFGPDKGLMAKVSRFDKKPMIAPVRRVVTLPSAVPRVQSGQVK
jgi:hypothetical protein